MLGVRAKEFAEQYVALVRALMEQGVVESVAREEARMAALVMVFQQNEDGSDNCPLCGGG